MGKSAADLMDAADAGAGEYTALDWVAWLLFHAGAFASAAVLWLQSREPSDGPERRENVVAALARKIETLISSGDVVQIAALVGFLALTAMLFAIQVEQRLQLRLVSVGGALGFAYTVYQTGGVVAGWLYYVPMFVWAAQLLSNVVDLVDRRAIEEGHAEEAAKAAAATSGASKG